MKCDWPTCKDEAITGSVYCFMHNRVYGKPVTGPAPKKPIAKQSAKAAAENKEYKKIVVEMLAESNKCELLVEGICTGIAQGLHHLKKRGANLLNRQFLKRACNACNGWCETHSHEAKELGIVLSKFN